MRPMLPLATRPYIPSRRRVRLRAHSGLCGAVAILLLAALASSPAAANPQGGTVTAGSATISTPTSTTTQVTQTTSKAVIDWQSFSIGSGETTNFVQPSSDSITLNRVVGGDASEILGRLTANGQVWLVNPNGIFFGTSATVDVAGLLATTQDIRNADFMAGRYDFRATGPGGYVINQGNITVADTGLVGLVAPYVANRGIITARLGEVALGSGSAFTVDFYGDQLINLALDQKVTTPAKDNTGKTVTSLVENSGKIFADGGRVTMTAAAAKGVVDKVIDTSGVIQANSVAEKDGEIYLLGEGGAVEVSGTLQAAGTSAGSKGGAVVVTGDTVTVKSTARIDVSGTAGGGQALIGGDVQGGKASAATLAQYGISNYRKAVPTAKKTTVEAGATITADATVNGKGGKVVVWADEDTLSYGTLSAKGGAQGGDGGFIETSGLVSLAVGGAADASAAMGIGGIWLLDPTDITITSSVTNGGSWAGSTPDVFSGSGTSATVYSGDINTALNSGTSVIINATTGAGTATGTITVNDPITKSSGGSASLTLTAGGAITINQAITSTSNALNVTLETATTSTVTIGASITTNGGSLQVGASGGNAALSITQSSGTTINAGSTTLKAGTITLGGTVQSTGNVSLLGDVAISGSVSAAASGTLRIEDSGDFLLNGGTLSAKSIIVSGSSIDLTGTITQTSGGSGNGGLTVLAAGSVTVGGAYSVSGSDAMNVLLQAGDTGTITINNSINTNGGTFEAKGASSLLIPNGLTLSTGATLTASDIYFQSAPITLNGTLVSTGDIDLIGGSVTLNSVGGGISLAGTLTAQGDTITLNDVITASDAGASVLLKSNNTIAIYDDMTLGAGSLTITDNGVNKPDVTISNVVDIAVGDVSLYGKVVSYSGHITSSGSVSLYGDTSLSLYAGSGITLTGSGKTLSLQSDDITLSGPIGTTAGSGNTVRLSGKTTATTIGVGTGASGTLNLTEAELANLSGFDTLEIGSGRSGGAITVDNSGGDGTVNLPTTTSVMGTSISIASGTTLAAPSSGTLRLYQASNTTFTLVAGATLSAANVVIEAGNVSLAGSLALTGSTSGLVEISATEASTGSITAAAASVITRSGSFDTLLKADGTVSIANAWNEGSGAFRVYGYSGSSYANLDISGTVTAGSVTADADGVTVSGGVSSTSDIVLTAKTSGIAVNGTVASSGGDVRLVSEASNQTFQTSGSAAISAGSGKVLKIQADAIDVSSGSSLSAPSGQVILEPTQATTLVFVNSGSSGFNLDSVELSRITTTRLTIGKANGANMVIGTLVIPTNITTLELSGTGLTFNGTVDGLNKNLWIHAYGGDVVFNETVGATDRLGTLTIDPPRNITAYKSVKVASLEIPDATGDVTFSAGLDATGSAHIDADGTLVGTFNVGSLTINTASSNISGSWGSFSNQSSDGTSHTVNGVVTTVNNSSGGGSTDTTSGGTSTTPGGTDTTSGGTDTTSGGTDTTSGGTDTTSGGTDTTSGGTDTTSGGTDTTSGGSDTTSGGTDTISGGGLDSGDTILGSIGGLGEGDTGTDTVIQQVASLTSDAKGVTAVSDDMGLGTGVDPLPELGNTSGQDLFGSGTTGLKSGESESVDQVGDGKAALVPLDDTGLPAYPSSVAVTPEAVREVVVAFTTTMTTSSAADAVADLAAKSLTNTEVRSVFDAMPAAEMVASLSAGGSALGQRIGALLQEALTGGAVTYADVKGVLDNYGADSELARTYLSLFQRIQKEARADLFAEALVQLRQNPDTADLFASPPEGKEAKPQFSGLRMSGMTPQGLARIEGKVNHPSPYVQLRVAGHWVFVDETGSFRAEIAVQAGDNEVDLSVVDDDGDRTVHRMTVNAPTTSPTEAMRPREGKRIALLFAARDYRDPNIPPLVTPKADADLVAKSLRDRMGFETRIVENGTKATMVEALRRLGRELTEADSAIVYYAGHGFALQETGNGYWLPVDATTDSPAQWISNQDVARLLHRMPAKHILLVADSCYSGAFTKEQAVSDADVERDPNTLRQRRSVMAMSSGGDEPVLDGDVNSPFATALVGQVAKLQTFEPGVAMFRLVHDVVVSKTPQTPQYGAVRFAGYDPGGDYLFDRLARGKAVAKR